VLRRSALLLLASVAALAHAGTNLDTGRPSPQATAAQAAADTTDRLIVRLRDPRADPRTVVPALGAALGERLEHLRAMSGDAQVARLARRVTNAEARLLAQRLRADPRVALAEPDALMHPMLVPNDPMYAQQWHYFEAAGGVDLPPAWDITTGSTSITVAVIDTGVRPHAELVSRLVAGWDFISDPAMSNDGDGRDPDASDPGDYGCNGANSSWHGTHVAGTIGASSNNGNGVTGVNWTSSIQPVRVLGRCGGYISDIVDAMRWAAGIAVAGVPANPTPARVENLSLGGPGACSSTFQSAVDDVTAAGAVVVVAAGNDGADASNTQPASCSGVIAVAATTRSGGLASYSNVGAVVTIAAPGGGGSDGVLSTLNTGTTTPAADSYAWYQGTSMATAHVSGVVSLVLSIDASLTPAQVAQRLRQTARPFPTGTGSDCTTSTCGAGIVDAYGAVNGLSSPGTGTTWTTIATEGQDFSVSGTQTVRYGAGSSWISRTVTGGGTCSNAWFGSDPVYGTVKSCQVAGAVSPGWTKIADENQGFTVNGTQTVRYGSGSSWISRSVTGSGICSNAWFGSDPLFGVVKECDVASSATTSWTTIATEGQAFSVSGTQTVRYGAGSSWITRTVTGTGTCSNDWFGTDPAYGIVKSCQVAS
jgi:serine protease